MSDIDGVIEDDGRLLFIEWKHLSLRTTLRELQRRPNHEAILGKGSDAQRIMYSRLTSLFPDCIVYLLGGEAETMSIRASQIFKKGKLGKVTEETLETFREKLKHWSGS